ncbi:nuclease [Sphingobium lactosutens]|uniref:nuclease n=1 Tax=Sphingobium lactosutens TaxID=522773 RepID=UPI0015BC1038|nr:nuclease [Sphingobium lactosutens]NWK97027.1 nuclease [Sphingobium lactosutens]
MRNIILIVAALGCALAASPALAWGERAHGVIDRAALDALPADGPVFLRKHADYIAASSTMPDSWRNASEPFSKIEEDPNHGWFREQFAFLKPIPRSRYEFILALHDEYLRIKDSDPQRASRTNVRWTGTLPYAAMESYGRIVVCMRQVRAAQATSGDTSVPERNCAYQVALLGHYIGDGAQPMHDSVHSDGWRGDNPKGFTTDRSVHGRFESQFVDLIALTPADIAARVGAIGHQQGDLFEAVLSFLDDAAARLETVYSLEKLAGFRDPRDTDVRDTVYAQTATGATMLRDMLYRAWRESAVPPAEVSPSPLDPTNPRYNPATGSAPG